MIDGFRGLNIKIVHGIIMSKHLVLIEEFKKLDINWRELKDQLLELPPDPAESEEEVLLKEQWYYYKSEKGKVFYTSNVVRDNPFPWNHDLGMNCEAFMFNLYHKECNECVSDLVKELSKPFLDKLNLDGIYEVSFHWIGPNAIVPKHYDIDPSVPGSFLNYIYYIQVKKDYPDQIALINDGRYCEVVENGATTLDVHYDHHGWNLSNDEWILICIKTENRTEDQIFNF